MLSIVCDMVYGIVYLTTLKSQNVGTLSDLGGFVVCGRREEMAVIVIENYNCYFKFQTCN